MEPKTQLATFAAGCFWHIEEAFRKVKGVLNVTVGYIGGKFENPTYKEVCSDKTGHAEAVQIEFDPSKISYENLLDAFWQMHVPAQLNRQGPDIGAQYRSAIFYHNEKQKNAAIKSKNELQKTEKYKTRKIVTEIKKAPEFYKAEEYHQRYFEKNKSRRFFTC